MTFPSIFKNKKKLFRTLKPFFYAGAAFAICMLCSLLVWYQYLTNVNTSSQHNLLNDTYTTTTAPLEDGVPLTQEFETISAIYEIGVYFERLSDTVAGELSIQLIDCTTGTVLLDTVGSIASVYYDSYTRFTLPEPVTTWDQLNYYQLVITAYYTTDADQLALKKSDVSVDQFYNLTENGSSAQGALAVMVTYDILGNTPVQAYFVLSVLFALCAAALTYLCFFGKGKFALSKPWLAFLVVFTAGLFYQFALPAYSAPDELSHYDTAYAVSNDWLNISPTTEGATLVKRTTDAQSTYVDYYTDAYTYRYIAENFFAGSDGTYIEESATLLGPYYLPYYLSAIGLTLGQLLGWGGIFTTFFARCLNLLFFAAMTAFSVKLAPFGKNIFIAVALLPISLHVGGSFSYDSCLLSLSFIILAFGLHLAYQKKRINWYEVSIFALLCFLIGPLKMAYFPLTLLALFIPAKRFAKTWQKYLVGFGIPLLSFAHFYARNFIAVIVQVSVSVDMDEAAEHIATLQQATVVETPIATYTLSTLLAYPGIALKLIINTFFTNFTSYVTSMLGGTLGYQDLAEVNLNILILFGFALLLIFACIKQKGDRTLPVAQRCLIGVSSLCVLGILVMACFSWTLITYTTIWGFQGRYLVPVLAFVMYALQPNGISTKNDTFTVVLYTGFFLNFLVLLNVVSVTFLR